MAHALLDAQGNVLEADEFAWRLLGLEPEAPTAGPLFGDPLRDPEHELGAWWNAVAEGGPPRYIEVEVMTGGRGRLLACVARRRTGDALVDAWLRDLGSRRAVLEALRAESAEWAVAHAAGANLAARDATEAASWAARGAEAAHALAHMLAAASDEPARRLLATLQEAAARLDALARGASTHRGAEHPTLASFTPGPVTVLVAEDEMITRATLHDVLTRAGYAVLEAVDGDDALAVARGHAGSLHLLVTDIVMPRMRGPELAAMLRRERPDLRVLYMSSYSRSVIEHHGLVEPGASFLQKPMAAAALLAAVTALVGPAVPAARR